VRLGTRASCPRGLSRVKFLEEMSGFLHSRAFLPLIPPTPFSHKGRRGILGFLITETREGSQRLPKFDTLTPMTRSHRCMRARRPFTQAMQRRALFQRARNIPERLKQ